jgi:hypothetical protein
MVGEPPELISQCRTVHPINFLLYNSMPLAPQSHAFDLRESVGIESGSSDIKRWPLVAVIAEDLLNGQLDINIKLGHKASHNHFALAYRSGDFIFQLLYSTQMTTMSIAYKKTRHSYIVTKVKR